MRKAFIRRYIMVKGKFAKLILEGVKTTTIRLGRVIPKSSEVIIHSEGRPIAEARIKNVVYKKVKELTEDDARRDGYPSLEDLLRDLRNIYKVDIGAEDEVTIIEFEVVKRLDKLDDADPYLGLEPHTIALLANRYLGDQLTEEEKNVVGALLKHKSIRTASIKLFGTLNKRWAIRRVLKRLLAKLIDRGVISVSEEALQKLAMISGFWRSYLAKRRAGDAGNGSSKENVGKRDIS